MCTQGGLSLTFDTGGEVFERTEIATAKSPERPTGRETGDLKPTSATDTKLAGSEFGCLGNSPPGSTARLWPIWGGGGWGAYPGAMCDVVSRWRRIPCRPHRSPSYRRCQC